MKTQMCSACLNYPAAKATLCVKCHKTYIIKRACNGLVPVSFDVACEVTPRG